jgi:small subunit ribosomal protein S19
MAKKEFTFYGKTLEEMKKMSLNEFAQLTNARVRRSLLRGLTDAEKILLKVVKANHPKIKTHCREMIILPDMVDKTILVYNGKEFIAVQITSAMLGHRLGEFVPTRRGVKHSAPGIGATKSSAAMSVK